MEKKELEKACYLPVMELRRSKLEKGVPFMINTHLLPDGQCYLEYPDGIIKVVAIDRSINDFKVIAELSMLQSNALRKKFKLT